MEQLKINNQTVGGGLSEVELVEEFLHENYEMRNNVLSKQIEVREASKDGSIPFRVLSREVQNSIILNCRKALGDDVKGIKSLVDTIINSEQTSFYDPIADYLNGLPKWDGEDRITKLWDCIPGLNEQQKYWLTVWLLSAVAHWLQMDTLHGNECVPIFISTHQGPGKSTFCQRLLPPQYRKYYLDYINLANKFDTDMALSNNLIVNIDEFDKVKPAQQAHLKQILSKSKVNGRPIYGRVQQDRHRYSSCVATTNCLHPLQDLTGSRRYICILIPDGQLIDNDTPIEYDRLYAQVLYMLRDEKARYWFTNEETLEIQQANSPFQKVVTLDEMIVNTLRQPMDNEIVEPISAKAIFETIRKTYPEVTSTFKNFSNLGKRLKDMGFKGQHMRAGTKYYVVPLMAA